MIPPNSTVEQVIRALVSNPKMMLRTVDDAGNPVEYKLAFDGHFLDANERFMAIPEDSTIDIIGDDTVFGGLPHPTDKARLYKDHDELMEMARLNKDVLQIEPKGQMRNGIHLSYLITITGVAGPMVDMDQAELHRQIDGKDLAWGAGPLLNKTTRALQLHDKFRVELRVMEGYPTQEPTYFYVDPLLCHPNVRVDTRQACLFKDWDGEMNSLATCVRKLVMQICYRGFKPSAFEEPFGADHLMNRSALEWVRGFLRQYPQGIPFRDRYHARAIALRMPASWKSGIDPAVPSQSTEIITLEL